MRLRIGRELAGDVPAVEAGQHHVEEHEVRLFLAGELEPGRPVFGLEHVEARGDEIDPAERPDRLLVVDYEHTSCRISGGLSRAVALGAASTRSAAAPMAPVRGPSGRSAR